LAEHQEERAHAYVKIPAAHRRFGIADGTDGHRAFDRRRRVPISIRPGRAGRTVRTGGAGKMFSIPGRKV
jgi:hypothetical protein